MDNEIGVCYMCFAINECNESKIIFPFQIAHRAESNQD